ncbi:MAG TPA: acetyl-CoA hydrolase/transferase C-terminal domain-containing protein, partial [Acidimicrobiales bacterium]|nr:acetyl-CoA hydrolase/transferase C-terminal domain-containing protein [Acidimicrobiales bacterium]
MNATAREAIAAFVQPGDRALLGTGAGEPTVLEAALVADQERLTSLRLCSGLQLGDYPYMGPVREGRWTYETWHLMHPIRDDVANGTVRLHLSRGAMVPRLIATLAPDVFLTSVSPPGPDGTHSFGASVSYALPIALRTGRVIAEVNPSMPWVRGDTCLPPERFSALVDVDAPLPQHHSRPPDETSMAISAHVHRLLPDDATVQIGLGAIPEGLVTLLTADAPPGLRLFGMGIDPMVPLLEHLDRPGAYVGGELLGTDTLYRFAHDNPSVLQYPLANISAVTATSAIDRFVSVTGAIEIDLTGQVNSEVAGGRTVSGPGGGFDFVDGSWFSDGGFSVVALQSTAKGGTRSTIVPRLAEGTPVTVPRHSVRYVATEYGLVDLFGLT